MKYTHPIPIAVVAVLALWIASAPAGAQTTPARVATANPSRIFNEIQETKDLQAKFNADLNALREQGKQRELQINDTRAARDSLKPDTPEWTNRNRDLMRLAIEYKAWEEMTKVELDRSQKQQLKMIFDRITESVAQVAQQRGIDLVIAEVRPDMPESLDQINADNLRARLISRNVLFSTPAVDISNDVIAAMDARYKSGGAGGASGAAPPPPPAPQTGGAGPGR